MSQEPSLITHAQTKPTETRHTHSVLIGTPLILILVFAFSFVLMHPVKSSGETATSRPTSNAHKAPSTTTTTLAPLPLAETTLPILTPVPVDGDRGGGASTGSTARLQAADNSSANSPSVQSAIPNTSTSRPNAPLSSNNSSSHSLLRGLLKVL